jgi:hypothetical protein
VGSACLSPALLAAQERLIKLRQTRLGVVEDGDGRSPVSNRLSVTSNPSSVIRELPEHLGWGSVPLTAVLRSKVTQTKTEPTWWQSLEAEVDNPTTPPTPNPIKKQTIRLHPSLALGLLREEQAASGRIWLLLRYLDEAGRGWLTIEEARAKLTKKDAPWRICGWRQLRNLLNMGENIFWVRGNGRIWLKSITYVAESLNIKRLSGKPVAVPLSILTENIGTVRAHFYAAFHSGRPSAPIARRTISKLSGVSRRSQHNYEARTHVRVERNFAIGQQAQTENSQQTAWQQGQALFHLQDGRGQQGAAGTTYLAWQLPNSYEGPHAQQSPSSRKRINRELADLWHKGTTGNGESVIEKRFFGNGQLAATAYNRAEREVYWQGDRNGRCRIWYCLQSGS